MVFKIVGARRPIAEGNAGTAWRVEPSVTGGVRLYRNGRTVKRRGRIVFGGPDRPLRVTFARYGARARLPSKGLNYAYGHMLVSTHDPGACGRPYCLRVVLAVSMHKYVYGLGEVPASWPAAVLRAQAIAARTYAFRRILRYGQHRQPCDCALVDSPADQVYSGDSKRTESGPYWDDWKGAVDATRNRVVVYRGRPIEALYSSSSGGHTENVENVWGGDPVPYLRGVRDAPDAVASNPNHRWRQRMSWRRASRRLNAVYGVGRLRRIRVLRPFGVSGRITVVKSTRRGGVRIVGRRATVRVSGWSLRAALGLRDTWFRVRIRRTVAAALAPAYARTGGPSGPLGRPASGRVDLGPWVAQRFAGGSLYLHAPTEATAALWGPIESRYRRLGETRSRCGPPTSSIEAGPTGAVATFARGALTEESGEGVVVDCPKSSPSTGDPIES
jgi:SpoIID/LytB domain protein